MEICPQTADSSFLPFLFFFLSFSLTLTTIIIFTFYFSTYYFSITIFIFLFYFLFIILLPFSFYLKSFVFFPMIILLAVSNMNLCSVYFAREGEKYRFFFS